ncbi:hypothetical protein [Sulfitobacter sp.]|uniref:hypothetical protein n=1 Tax=Sulfitobacter sp. TaxID=1903071 RepID=UPI0030028C1B
MADVQNLTDDQKTRIAATLARIRAGLNASAGSQFEEPAHIYVPEAHHAQDK